MAVVEVAADLTITTGWNVRGSTTSSIGGALTVIAVRPAVGVWRFDPSLNVTATATAVATVPRSVTAALQVTATPTPNMVGTPLLAQSPLTLFVSPTAVVNNLIYTPSPGRTWYVPKNVRSWVVSPVPRRLSLPMPFKSRKDPDAVLDYTLDWSRELSTGDTIIAAVFTPDAGITKDSSSFTFTTTTVWLSGGTSGVTYAVKVHITTAAGRQDDRTIEIGVVNE